MIGCKVGSGATNMTKITKNMASGAVDKAHAAAQAAAEKAASEMEEQQTKLRYQRLR